MWSVIVAAVAYGRPEVIGVLKAPYKEVVREILKLMNRGEELIEYVTDRPGHDRHYAIDPSSIMSLGWRPHHDFSSGLKDTVEHYLKYGKKYGF